MQRRIDNSLESETNDIEYLIYTVLLDSLIESIKSTLEVMDEKRLKQLYKTVKNEPSEHVLALFFQALPTVKFNSRILNFYQNQKTTLQAKKEDFSKRIDLFLTGPDFDLIWPNSNWTNVWNMLPLKQADKTEFKAIVCKAISDYLANLMGKQLLGDPKQRFKKCLIDSGIIDQHMEYILALNKKDEHILTLINDYIVQETGEGRSDKNCPQGRLYFDFKVNGDEYPEIKKLISRSLFTDSQEYKDICSAFVATYQGTMKNINLAITPVIETICKEHGQSQEDWQSLIKKFPRLNFNSRSLENLLYEQMACSLFWMTYNIVKYRELGFCLSLIITNESDSLNIKKLRQGITSYPALIQWNKSAEENPIYFLIKAKDVDLIPLKFNHTNSLEMNEEGKIWCNETLDNTKLYEVINPIMKQQIKPSKSKEGLFKKSSSSSFKSKAQKSSAEKIPAVAPPALKTISPSHSENKESAVVISTPSKPVKKSDSNTEGKSLNRKHSLSHLTFLSKSSSKQPILPDQKDKSISPRNPDSLPQTTDSARDVKTNHGSLS